MEVIQIVLASELRIDADLAAREERDREGFRKNPAVREDAKGWEGEAAWPTDPVNL